VELGSLEDIEGGLLQHLSLGTSRLGKLHTVRQKNGESMVKKW